MAWPQQEISLAGTGIVLVLFDCQPVAVVPTTWRLPAASFTATRLVADLAGSFPVQGRPGVSAPCAFCCQCRIVDEQSDTVSKNRSKDQPDWTAIASFSWWLSYKAIGLAPGFAESKQATRSCLFSSLTCWSGVFWVFFSTLHIRAGMLR